MLEGIIADVLVRILGSYVDGLNKESIRLGVWGGNLELRHLRLRPDALAVLFETLGLDLPVTVTAGYIGLLRLEVPWKALRSAPVRIFMHDVTIVASPVSDGDQAALEMRDKRLKTARLATDEALRDAKFSVRANITSDPSATLDDNGSTPGAPTADSTTAPETGYRVTRWGWRFTSRIVTKIVDNIQIDVENVIVQYEDSSSVREKPYTVTLALDSLRAFSTGCDWNPVFLEDAASPVVHKVLYLNGLVLNWEPGVGHNDLKTWILDPAVTRAPGQWAGFVRSCNRHTIKPMHGELRIALTKSAALASALAGKDDSLSALAKQPRVKMDLHFPDVQIALDDFQYHTLLSTVMYLSDIDRKVRPKSARARWFWALDRLLPRFKERREAALRFNAGGLRERRELREKYCLARNSVVNARRKGSAEPAVHAVVVEEIESAMRYEDILLFRDVADRQLAAAVDAGVSGVATTSRFWSLFSRTRTRSTSGSTSGSAPVAANTNSEEDPNASDGGISTSGIPATDNVNRIRKRERGRPLGSTARGQAQELKERPSSTPASGVSFSSLSNLPSATLPRTSFQSLLPRSISLANASELHVEHFDVDEGGHRNWTGLSGPDEGSRGDTCSDDSGTDSGADALVPNFRMAFLLGRGAIQLSRGGYLEWPVPVASLEFRELRLGIETSAAAGFLIEALLGTFEVMDLRRQMKVMYPRVPWAGRSDFDVVSEESGPLGRDSQSSDAFENQERLLSEVGEQFANTENEKTTSTMSATIDRSTPGISNELIGTAKLDSYPDDVSTAIREIRGEYGLVDGAIFSTPSLNIPRSTSHTVNMSPGTGSSSGSLSGLSDGGSSTLSLANREDLSLNTDTPLRYIAALRLTREDAPEEGEWAPGATRMAMDLAIGGMEVLVDGPDGAFISSINFWHPREKMPSIMQFLSTAAATRLASLRMDLQRALTDRSVPMRMDLLIRGPRFVIPGPPDKDLSLVLDLGTFAMETAVGSPEPFVCDDNNQSAADGISSSSSPLESIRYTDYRMVCSDLGVFVVSAAGKQAAERLVKPFSLHLLLQVLNNTSFVEAMTAHLKRVDVAKVRLGGQLSSVKTSLSREAFRQLLEIAKGWGGAFDGEREPSGIEPNKSSRVTSLTAAELNEMQNAVALAAEESSRRARSPLVGFQMRLELEDLLLELRDSSARRVVTMSSAGTLIKLKRRPDVVDFDYRVRTFTVTDGSRGATAPFRQLAYAGVDNSVQRRSRRPGDPSGSSTSPTPTPLLDDGRAFISLSYRGDLVKHEQALAVHILSLNLVCVRETYLALADFFYLVERKERTGPVRDSNEENEAAYVPGYSSQRSGGPAAELESSMHGEYSDPFAALGMTTSGAARKLREQAERGMELSKQALAQRGTLSVSADLDGLNLTLVTAEGAIASFDVTDCTVRLQQSPTGAIDASGELGGFGIKDLTSAYEVYSETIRYRRHTDERLRNWKSGEVDGWSLRIPEEGVGDAWLTARLRNLRIVYLQRFIIILKKYFDVLRENLRPILEMKGGIADVFEAEGGDGISALAPKRSRLRLDVVTEDVDIIMPRHSQSPHEALRFVVPKSSITNDDIAAPGYRIGFQIRADGINAYVLYTPPAEGEGRALTAGGKDPVLREISPGAPTADLTPFSDNISIVGKLDWWRRRRVPQVALNSDGVPVLKDGEEEREFDPTKWLPAIRVRISAPDGLSARLSEAEYSILYFAFSENIIERPDIEFTDIVRGLKTPVLPPRRPVQPIMVSSNRMPPNYRIVFEVPVVESIIMSGSDPTDSNAYLIRSELRDLVGSFEYGVDFRMTVEVSANMHSLTDIRPGVSSQQATLITPIFPRSDPMPPHGSSGLGTSNKSAYPEDDGRTITLTWDRPFGFRANVMVVVSDLRIIVAPELFRDLGLLTAPGFPYLKSSAPAPFLRFNGRLLIVTVSRPEVWLMANQFPGDGRSLVIRGDLIAKVQWAAVTGRNMIEVASNGLRVNLSCVGPEGESPSLSAPPKPPALSHQSSSSSVTFSNETETPLLYPCDVSCKFDGSGYDPPKRPGETPTKLPGSSLSVSAESLLGRIDVNDTPLLLAVGSRFARLRSSVLSKRPTQPGRFDEWIDKGEDGDARLSVHFSLPHLRLIFTDESAGRYIPIMEARVRNGLVRANVPWLTNANFMFSLDLFNEEKGWWEPGIESFPLEIAASRGRSGSQAIHVRTEKNIDVNVTPTTISGAARVAKALKSAVEGLAERLQTEDQTEDGSQSGPGGTGSSAILPLTGNLRSGSRRPSVAAYCVRNETGRSVVMWLPYDSNRRSLRGSGDEFEVDMPTDQLLWPALSSVGSGLSSDANRNRHVMMRCFLAFNGYEPLALSTAEIVSRVVTFVPDGTQDSSTADLLQAASSMRPLHLVWDVTMRDGVPIGCLRSVVRIVNTSRTVLEVTVGQQLPMLTDGRKKSVVNSASRSDMAGNDPSPNKESYAIVKAGGSWSVPVHAVSRPIHIRPALFHAPDPDRNATSQGQSNRVLYSYRWSDPLSKLATLHSIGKRLQQKKEHAANSSTLKRGGVTAPIVSCRASVHGQPFCFSVLPVVGVATESEITVPSSLEDSGRWLELRISAPIIIENLLPRPLAFVLTESTSAVSHSSRSLLARGNVGPLRSAHVHTAGATLRGLAVALGVDNNPQDDSVHGSKGRRNANLSKHIGELHTDIPALRTIPMGTGRYTPFNVNLEHDATVASQKLKMYSDFWIRNRSDVDLFFRDAFEKEQTCASGRPKIFLRGRPPGTSADPYICFSGGWLAFQRADATQDLWVDLGTEVPEIHKPSTLGFSGLSLTVEVRPAKGRFQRALIVTIRNSVWLENRTGSIMQWCQPAALNPRGIAISSKVHSVMPGAYSSLHWDFQDESKAICLRRADEKGSSEWIWSRPVAVDGVEGEFAAKMYRPKRHEQYIARVVVVKLARGVSAVVIHREDRSTPPYRIVNHCAGRSVAFRQAGVNETHPWLVRPGKTTRYSWDDPQAPLKRRALIVEVIEPVPEHAKTEMMGSSSSSALAGGLEPEELGSQQGNEKAVAEPEGVEHRSQAHESRYPKFELNIDMITEDAHFSHWKRFTPRLLVSVRVDGPTKVVTFEDVSPEEDQDVDGTKAAGRYKIEEKVPDQAHLRGTQSHPSLERAEAPAIRNLDVEVFVKSLGISFVESTAPAELAYLFVSGVQFRADRFDGQQLVICEIQDVQLDNQLSHCAWPVVLWSPPPEGYGHDLGSSSSSTHGPAASARSRCQRKPFFQLTMDGPHPHVKQGIGMFRGIFVALQQLQIAVDEDFVLRVWLFVTSLFEAAGGANQEQDESLHGRDGQEGGLPALLLQSHDALGSRSSVILNRLYVEHLELCPLKLSISFTSSRTSSAAERVGGFRSALRTLVAVLGNVENAEFRFNALELAHVFDTTAHFRSLIAEFYLSQGSNQKMALLASNSLVGNPSALFDSIAIGTRDFFVEPAKAKGSADFIAGIGRGSSSLLTNTVGGIVGSLGGIPRAVAQGLETAVGDRNYLAERDSIRGGRARVVASPAQGLFTGALSFGHGIASGAAGLIRDPLQGAAEEGPSGFLKGLGKGFIGGVLKPITGALDLIAEPAAGFRSMMVSERNKDAAEPSRPPRAFWGASADRMVTYDLRAALGLAVLQTVNRGESELRVERVREWTHLVTVHASASEDDVILFLWALLRRSTRTSHLQSKYLSDAQGNPQRADKMRVGLITNRRIIVTSLDGNVVWEYPLADVVDTQVSLEAKDYLVVGVRPIAHGARPVVAPMWHRIHCGSMASRDELNSSLRKVLADMRSRKAPLQAIPGLEGLERERGAPVSHPGGVDHHRERSVEMIDMSAIAGGDDDDVSGQMTELKTIHRDASVDGRRGVFTSLQLPGRQAGQGAMEHLAQGSPLDADVLKVLSNALASKPNRQAGSVRSVRVFFVNLLDSTLTMVRSSLESGAWAQEPPLVSESMSVSVFEADSTLNRMNDVCGSVVLKLQGQDDNALVAVRFINPLLASNAYGLDAPPGIHITCAGGERGDHVQTVITVKQQTNKDIRSSLTMARSRASVRRTTGAEPLLFGRSTAPKFLPPTATPPHNKRPQSDPNDPELIAKLVSLGFSRIDSQKALHATDGDLPKAFAILQGEE